MSQEQRRAGQKLRPATVSVDVDPIDLHLVGYGITGQPADAAVYERAVPRLLERFAANGIRATWFFVARDAEVQRAAIRSVVAAGHEVASHSISHPLAFSSLPQVVRSRELRESRERLEAVTGERVLGFRAPNWDLDTAAAQDVADAGYRYDSSGYPTPLLFAARLLQLAKAGQRRDVLRLRWLPFCFRSEPFAWRGSLREFPVSVTRWLRFPVYHTASYMLSGGRFEALIDGLAARGAQLSYPLHAVDALGLREDDVDVRLAPHPGMDRALPEKLALLDRSLAAIARGFEPLCYRERLEAEPASAS